MKRSITFPMKIESENTYRTIDHRRAMANMARTKKQRNDTMLILASLPKPAHSVEGEPNRIRVTLTRISPGRLDKEENLTGGFKAVKDAVTEWCGLRDDSDPRFTWLYEQQGCPLKQFGVRIDIDDDAPGPDVRRILGDVPARLTAPSERGIGGPKALPPPAALERPAQVEIAFRPAFARLPWDGPGVVTEMPIAGDAPAIIRMRVPARGALGTMRPGTVVLLHRHPFESAELGSVWMYTTDAPVKAGRRTG